ncbi:hypothetical protein PFISCL1PPCAC_16307 [Pristionchus fissidentatus]|uniref:Protein kinase domain-containing protein n=1 Tax=Pristionchus fissidentatus TaxID=1538716 RepID=A0AAV5VZL6_9BILA|nr:hypothetical protein PFISCL1PPCAC_16307 [Pristionchus fissidentatus]
MRKAKSRDSFQLSDFELGDVIGEGGFGVVYKAIWKIKNEAVAIKKINSNQRSDRLRLEVENHQKSEHDNIVKFYGHFKENGEDYIVMELCQEGSIRSYIKNIVHGPLSRDQVVSVMFQLVNTLEYLHSKKLVHRDLTAGNILIKRFRDNGVPLVKICDFGLAKVMSVGRAAHTMAGTPGYMDPCVAKRGNYGKEVDLYSLGAVFYMMLTGDEPKPDRKGNSRNFPEIDTMDDDAADLLRSLTCPEDSRIKLEAVKQSEFMKCGRGENSMRSRSRDHPTSIHGRRASTDYKSTERRARNSIDHRDSLRERSKSRGALRERNRSPTETKQLYPSRSSSQLHEVNKESKQLPWPINIDRLAGKNVEGAGGYRLEVTSGTEVVLSKDRRDVMWIRVDPMGQAVGIVNCHRGHVTPCFRCVQSTSQLPSSLHPLYEIVLKLLEDIRWKVAKVIFNNSNICEGGVIRLMENGDLRMKDAKGTSFFMHANSQKVYEGDPRRSGKIVTDADRIAEIRKFRELCEVTAATIQRLGLPFPFTSYVPTEDTATVMRKGRDALRDQNRASVTSGTSTRPASVEPMSRPRSTASAYRRPAPETIMTNYSAPSGTNQYCDKENKPTKLVLLRAKDKTVRGVKDEESGVVLRMSTVKKHEYIFTENGHDQRFIFTGDFNSLPTTQRYLMTKLQDRQ